MFTFQKTETTVEEITRAEKPKRFRPTLGQYRQLQDEVECLEKTADSLRIVRDELRQEYRKADKAFHVSLFLAVVMPIVGFLFGYILRGMVK